MGNYTRKKNRVSLKAQGSPQLFGTNPNDYWDRLKVVKSNVNDTCRHNICQATRDPFQRKNYGCR